MNSSRLFRIFKTAANTYLPSMSNFLKRVHFPPGEITFSRPYHLFCRPLRRSVLFIVADVHCSSRASLFLNASYFQHLWQLSMTSWTTEDSNALERCGHCDNCIRQAAPTHTFRTEDITVPVWQIIRIVGETQRLGAKVTMASLTQLVRTKVKAEVEVKRGRGKQKVQLNLQDLCGGPVDAKMFSAEVSCATAQYTCF